MKARIYLSGPLFSSAEIRWGAEVKAFLLGRFGERIDLIWPHEFGGMRREIFEKNRAAIDGSDLMVAILDGPQVDDGTAWEIGYHHARGGRIIALRTDFRRAGEEGGAEENGVVNAMVEFSCLSISRTLEDLAKELKRLLP